MSKKDIKVEIMRIIGCLGVIAYHTRTVSLLPDGTVGESALFIECITSVSLTFFFLINGFYIYNKKNNIFKDWYRLIINFIKNFLIPVIIFLFIVIIFEDYLLSNKGLIDTFKNINIKNTIETLLSGFIYRSEMRWPLPARHLWYVFAYGSIILYYPLTRLFLKLDKKYVYIILLTIGAYHIYTDLNLLSGNEIYTKFFDIIPRPVIYSIWGYILYNDILKVIREKSNNNIILNNKLLITAIIIYIISFVSIYMMEYKNFTYYHTSHTFASWYSFGELMMAIALEAIIYDINIEKICNINIKNCIYYIAGATLGIYILHAPIMIKLISTGISNIFNTGINMNPIYKILYLVFYNMMIFIIAFTIINIWRMCVAKARQHKRRTR